nr:integrase, catalytic region, zinc finger, CCHC-type, peptidase aspartic, catalytic [Tanacetum cinerariifolium]
MLKTILVPKLPKNCARCARRGHPVDGSYCQGCALLRKKPEENLVTYFQDFQNTSESSNDSTNVVNALQEPFVVKQDHDVNSSQNPPHIDECCYKCGDALDGIFCQRCTSKSCGKGQFCDSYLEVTFRQHSFFIRNLDGVDLLTGSRGNNHYTLSLQDMMVSSPIYLLSKASKTKSWLWHRRPMRVESVNGKNDNLGKLQTKADIRIFIGYAPTKKAFRIYNRRLRRIVETIHVDFDELTAMASEHRSLGPAHHKMTLATISLGHVQKSSSSTPFLPPSRND